MKNKAKVFENKGRIYKGGGAEITGNKKWYLLLWLRLCVLQFRSTDTLIPINALFYFLGKKTSLKFHLLIFY